MNLTKHLNTCHFKRYKCITNCCTLYSWEGMRTSKETYIILGLQHYLTHEMKNKRWPTTTTHFETTKRPLQHHMTFEGISDFVYLDSMNCLPKFIYLLIAGFPTVELLHTWHIFGSPEKKMVQRMKEDERPMRRNSGHAMDDPLENHYIQYIFTRDQKKGW